MPFLTHAQLRHGAWGSSAADSAHSSRGLFPGPAQGRIAWQFDLGVHPAGPVEPVIDADGNLYTLGANRALLGLSPQGAPLIIPDRTDLPFGQSGDIPPELCLGPGGTVVVAAPDAVSCLTLRGAVRWHIKGLAGRQPVVSPDGSDVFVLQGRPDGYEKWLVALGMGTGIEHWRVAFTAGALSAVAIGADGVLYLTACYESHPQHRLVAIDGRSGEELWRQKIAPTLDCPAPRLFGDGLIFVSGDSGLQVFHPGGSPAWTVKQGAMSRVAVTGAGQAVFFHGPKASHFDSISVYWPDGQVQNRLKLESGALFTGAQPVLDAVGGIYAGVMAPTGAPMLQRFNLDLQTVWTLNLPAEAARAESLAVGRETLILAGAVASTGNGARGGAGARGAGAAGHGSRSRTFLCIA